MTLKDLRGVTDYDYSRADFRLAWREFCDAWAELQAVLVAVTLYCSWCHKAVGR